MSCGLCLQKLVQKKIAEDPSKGPAYKNSMYIAGISYVGMGLIMKAVLNALLPQSTIAVLSAQTVVFTAVLEYLMLQGEMKTRTMICLAVIIGGIVLSMCGANIIDGEYSFEELRPLFVTRTSILVTTSSIAAIVAVREFLKITSSKNPGNAVPFVSVYV
jgi:multidrug transporter EmrE-like cation transporter